MPSWNSALTAVLRGEAPPRQLQAMKDSMLGLLDQLRDDVEACYRQGETTDLSLQIMGDTPVTLAVIGERGYGKSTLLVSVCAALLRQGQDLVLPISRPDLFAESDTVMSSFLASLWTAVARRAGPTQSPRDTMPPQTETELLRLIAETARTQATSQAPIGALEHGTDSAVDFAEDSMTVSRSSARMASQLRHLAERLCLPDDGRPPRLVILPIDDPDLEPSRTSHILRDLRVLGSVPGVVPIVCFSETDLTTAWISERRSRGLELPRERLTYLYEREMQKIFPYHSRFEIRPQSASQRVTFAPVARAVTMGEQLRVFAALIDTTFGVTSHLAEALASTTQAYELPNPLPSNPRSLVQMWEVLNVRDVRPDEARATLSVALRRILDLVSEPLRWKLMAETGQEKLYDLELTDPQEEGDRRIRVNLDAMERLRVFIGSTTTFDTSPRLRSIRGTSRGLSEAQAVIQVRPISRVRASIVDNESNSDAGMRYLKAGEVASLFAIQQIVYGTGAFEIDASSPRLFLGLDEWVWLQHITLGGLATDDIFILMPEATTLAETQQTCDHWNSLVDVASDVFASEYILTAAVTRACDFLVHDRSTVPTTYWEAFERACALYDGTAQPARAGDVTERSFRVWFERDILFQWHSALLGGEQARRLCERHRAVVGSKDTEDSSIRAAVDPFDRRLKRIIDSIVDDATADEHCWIAGYFDVASMLKSSYVDSLGKLHWRWQERLASIRTVAAATGDLVLSTSGTRKLAPYPSPEGQQLMTSAREALERFERAARASMQRQARD